MTVCEIGKGLLLLLLGWSAWTDLRIRKIWWPPAALLGIAGAAASVWMTWQGQAEGGVFGLAGLLPGVMLLAVSLVNDRTIGRGDCLLILAFGSWHSLIETVEWLFISFTLCGVCALLLILLRRITPKTTLPFVPFLLAAALWIEIW
ncbi:MAG: hypothetical protein Q4B59_05615 [Lachnospiraceae bacterium]|nr:hypothetical protein [Lachnospiraceae bacterium]